MDGRAYCALTAVKNADEEIMELHAKNGMLEEQIIKLRTALDAARARRSRLRGSPTTETPKRWPQPASPTLSPRSPPPRDVDPSLTASSELSAFSEASSSEDLITLANVRRNSIVEAPDAGAAMPDVATV